jgi:AcrR family transcriptional regulator
VPRPELLAAVVAHLRRHGLGDASLREIAAAVGSSHRMLIHHFGSRDGLLAAVVTEVERQQLATAAHLADGVDPTEALLRGWRSLSGPDRADEERLFFELAARALRGVPGTEPLRQRLVEPWLELGQRAAEQAGVDPTLGRTVTRADVAIVRGLLLDLLATGDRDGVEAAFGRYLAWRAAGIAGDQPDRQPNDE